MRCNERCGGFSCFSGCYLVKSVEELEVLFVVRRLLTGVAVFKAKSLFSKGIGV